MTKMTFNKILKFHPEYGDVLVRNDRGIPEAIRIVEHRKLEPIYLGRRKLGHKEKTEQKRLERA